MQEGATEVLADKGLASGQLALDKAALALAAGGLVVLYWPVVGMLVARVWSSVEQSYGPVFLATAGWFLWQRRQALCELATPRRALSGWALLLLALPIYVLGVSQESHVVATFSVLPAFCGVLVLLRGRAALRVAALPIVLLAFVVPLPADIVASVTMPLKVAVSTVATEILRWLDQPVARSGVILHVGQYQLLVADACAGLTSMFTLEAVGLVYMGIRGKVPREQDVALALLLVPIAFLANVIRVLVLVFVTLHFGAAASEGFVHDFAGLFLFALAGVMMLAADGLLRRIFGQPAVGAVS